MKTLPKSILMPGWLGLCLLFASCKEPSESKQPVNPPATSTTFRNPLLAGGPDPWVIRKDGFYYYCHTVGNRIRLWKTPAMSQLNTATTATVWTPPSSGPNSMNIWAPELHFLEGKWYLYYTAGANPDLATQRTWVLENASPDPLTGTWVDKGQIYHADENFWAIDGTVLQLNGVNYFIWSGHLNESDNTQRIYIARMTITTIFLPILSPSGTRCINLDE